MAWIYLFLAGLLEVGFVLGLKFSDGMTKIVPTAVFLLCELLSFFLLSQALKVMPAGTVYTIFTAIGAIGTVLVGMVWLGESRDILRIGAIAIIVIGVVCLHAVSGE